MTGVDPGDAGAVARPALPPRMTETGVVAVVRVRDVAATDHVIAGLVSGGVTSIELTMTTPGVLDSLPALLQRFGDEAELGVGTVLTRAVAERALDAGARFLVTPSPAPEVIAAAAKATTVVIPGGFTPGELSTNWSQGVAAVKLFPASTVGPDYLGHLRGPFPDMRVVPSGGIALDQVPRWIAAGALAVSLGGPLVGDAGEGGDLAALTARARRAVELVAEARAS